jgi:hypothetical protein
LRSSSLSIFQSISLNAYCPEHASLSATQPEFDHSIQRGTQKVAAWVLAGNLRPERLPFRVRQQRLADLQIVITVTNNTKVIAEGTSSTVYTNIKPPNLISVANCAA